MSFPEEIPSSVALIKGTWVCKPSLAGLGSEIQSLPREKRKEKKNRRKGQREGEGGEQREREKLHTTLSLLRAGWECATAHGSAEAGVADDPELTHCEALVASSSSAQAGEGS